VLPGSFSPFLHADCNGRLVPRLTGVVSLDGKPLESGSVLFMPTRGRAAIGIIQPDGTYSLTTYHDNDGAIVGSHTVTVSPYIAQTEENAEVTLPTPSGVHTVTRRFSGIAVSVESGKVNQIPIALDSKSGT
jgi:hypothetical protein